MNDGIVSFCMSRTVQKEKVCDDTRANSKFRSTRHLGGNCTVVVFYILTKWRCFEYWSAFGLLGIGIHPNPLYRVSLLDIFYKCNNLKKDMLSSTTGGASCVVACRFVHYVIISYSIFCHYIYN